MPISLLDDRAGDQVEAELARRVARPRDRRTVERLGTRHVVVVLAEHVELLGKDDQVGSVRGGIPYEPVRRGHIPILVVRRVELYGRCPHLSPRRLTDQSIAVYLRGRRARDLSATSTSGLGNPAVAWTHVPARPRRRSTGARAAPAAGADAAQPAASATEAMALRRGVRTRASAVR